MDNTALSYRDIAALLAGADLLNLDRKVLRQVLRVCARELPGEPADAEHLYDMLYREWAEDPHGIKGTRTFWTTRSAVAETWDHVQRARKALRDGGRQ